MNRVLTPERVEPRLPTRYSLLTTWILWRNLLQPREHPLFRWTLRQPFDAPATSTLLWMLPLLSTFACCRLWALIIPLKASFVVILPVAIIGFSTCYVVVYVLRITITITNQREHGTYEQICLSPSGALGTTWALCAAALHRSDALGWIDSTRKVLTGLLYFTLISILVTTALRQDAATLSQFWILLFEMTALAAGSYIDHVHSMVLGSLVGMLAPTQASGFDARLWAAGVFLSLQAITCATTLLTPLVLLPALDTVEALVHWNFPLSPLIASLLVFYATREVLITLCWQVLARQLNANPAEYRFWD